MLSSIIITKNEQEMITDCLVSLEFSDEILVVDTGNTDLTNSIAIGHGAKIIKSKATDYAGFRNDGLKAAKGDWILYLDADERITPALRQEIINTIESSAPDYVYQIPRQNIYLGRIMHYGGWGHDRVIRLFPKKLLKGYLGALHEQPELSGELKTLTQSMTHFSHRDLTSMLNKTIDFTNFEANLRVQAQHPKMSWWRFLRVMLTEFYLRFIKLSAARDGKEGIIDGLFQVFNTFVIYARLWELQLNKDSK